MNQRDRELNGIDEKDTISVKPPSASQPRVPEAGKKRAFYIVGMGGSAGSLESFEEFFKNIPADTGLAFVVVSHLDPIHKGIMPELLQRLTSMNVSQAEDGDKVQPNSVYVIPPGKDLSILHGTLQLLEPSQARGFRMPIDFFFRHLAEDQGERAIGIIFSGMGTDGTLGLKAIKEKQGMVMVEDPTSTTYDAMPKSARVEDFLVEHDFPKIGHKRMLLNARRLGSEDSPKRLILLAIEDITDRKAKVSTD